MNVQNRPTYRLSANQLGQLRYYLTLIDKDTSDVLMTCRERRLAQQLSSVVTEQEFLYLRCYYLEHMTQQMIAQRLRRNPSSVTRGIARARNRLLKAAQAHPLSTPPI